MNRSDIKNLDLDSLLSDWKEIREATLSDVAVNLKKDDHLRALRVLGESGAGTSLAHAMYLWTIHQDIGQVQSEVAQAVGHVPGIKDLVAGALAHFMKETPPEGALSRLRSSPFLLVASAVLSPSLASHVETLTLLAPFLFREDTKHEGLDATVLLTLLKQDDALASVSLRKVNAYLADQKIKPFFKGDYILAKALLTRQLDGVEQALNQVDIDFDLRGKDHKVLGQLQGLSWGNQIEIDLFAVCLLRLARRNGILLEHDSRAVPAAWINM